MKRILAILVLIFITSLYTTNIVYTINNEKPIIVKVDKFKKNIKLDTLKREVKIKTPEIISKNIIILYIIMRHGIKQMEQEYTENIQLPHIIMFQKEQNF